MIFIVDEDIAQLRSFKTELEVRGYTVKPIRNADEAFDILVSFETDDVDLVLIDVMLAAGCDESTSRYNRENSDNFMKTGLLLLNDLILQNPDVFPAKAIIFTNSTNEALLGAIGKVCEEHGVLIMKKKDFETAYEFGNTIEGILNSKQPSGGQTQ